MSVQLVARSIFLNPGNRGRRLRKSFTAVAWQIRKRTVGNTRRLLLPNGARFQAHPDCVVSSSLIYCDWPEYDELKFIRSQLRTGDLVVDVGANVGHISLLLSDVVGADAIFAFEPTPLTFARLVHNWELNGWNTDRLYPVAVGGSDSTTFVPDVSHPLTTNSVRHERGESGHFTEVPMVKLDSIRDLWREKTIGLLKIDVEGYEAEVFRGATALLQELRPRLIMFESLTRSVDPGLLETLRNSSYVTFQLGDDGNPDYAGSGAQNVFAIPAELANRGSR